jgi:hypothetical protein
MPNVKPHKDALLVSSRTLYKLESATGQVALRVQRRGAKHWKEAFGEGCDARDGGWGKEGAVGQCAAATSRYKAKVTGAAPAAY